MKEATGMGESFEYINGSLCAGTVSLERVADLYGTPLYVYFLPAIRDRIEAVRGAFASHPTTVCYSVKANSNLKLLRWLYEEDVGFDVVSGGELQRLGRASATFEKTVFAGVGKNRAELELAVRSEVWIITLESLQEAQLLADVTAGSEMNQYPVALRLNVDVDADTHPHIKTARNMDKFGIGIDMLPEVLRWFANQDSLNLVGLHMHLGSQITSVEPYRRGMEKLMEAVRQTEAAGFQVSSLNAGGGFGISHDDTPVPGPEDYAAAILPFLEDTGIRLILELGRFIVGPSGCVITEVLYRKRHRDLEFLITDAGMTDFMRPALYGAIHRILPLKESIDGGEREYQIAGPVCESADFLGLNRYLPHLQPGERLAVLDTGAYGMVMTSNYISRPKPAEVWINESGEVELIRRRETTDDMMAVELDTPET